MSLPVSRRKFVWSAGVAGLAGFFSILPRPVHSEPRTNANGGLIRNPDEGDVYLIGERQGRVTIKIDKRHLGNETMSLLTEDIVSGDEIPVHKHGAEEEFIYIERGRGMLTFGDDEFEVVPGSMALVPRGVWHGLRNDGRELLRMVFGYTPAGFEDYFRAIGVKPGRPWKGLTEQDWVRINAEFRVVYR